MTPKEKAESILRSYSLALKCDETKDGYFYNINHAKQCALICINELRDKNEDLKFISLADYVDGFEYLNELEIEINNL